MWSMWNAPSDRDYYEPYGRDEEDEEPEYCQHCGARWDQACEEWCDTNVPASEAPPAGQTERGASPGIRLPVPASPSTDELGPPLKDCVLEPSTDRLWQRCDRAESRPKSGLDVPEVR